MFDLLSSPGCLVWDLSHRVSSGRFHSFTLLRSIYLMEERPEMISLISSGRPSLVQKDTHAHTHTHTTATFSLPVKTNCANTPCSQLCVCVSLCARKCAYCGSPNCKQAVLSNVCVWLSVPFVGLFEFVCVHLCFSMRERELEWDRDKESISLYPGAWRGPKWKALDMMGQLTPALISQSHQSWLYASHRVGFNLFVLTAGS